MIIDGGPWAKKADIQMLVSRTSVGLGFIDEFVQIIS
jgi:hypothetical protein